MCPSPTTTFNLDGAIGLGDLGNIIGRWGQTSSCSGWIRADVNNDGAVGLADIGKVTAHWGQAGFISPGGGLPQGAPVADVYGSTWAPGNNSLDTREAASDAYNALRSAGYQAYDTSKYECI